MLPRLFVGCFLAAGLLAGITTVTEGVALLSSDEGRGVSASTRFQCRWMAGRTNREQPKRDQVVGLLAHHVYQRVNSLKQDDYFVPVKAPYQRTGGTNAASAADVYHNACASRLWIPTYDR